MIKHLFFDLDGTLLDTQDDIRGCMKEALNDLGLPIEGIDERLRIGPPLALAVREALPDIRDDQLIAFIDLFRKKYDLSTYPQTRPYPGIESLIQKLKQDGYNLYIATNKRRYPAKRILTCFHWDEYFEDVFAVDMIEGKTIPKRDMLLLGMQKYGAGRKSSVMIGDTPGDVAAGKEIGIRTIGVSWGYATRHDVHAANPSALADQAFMIADMIRLLK